MSERNASRENSVPSTPTMPEGGATLSPFNAMMPAQLGAYTIQARLGQGGMGTVYCAWHTRLKRIVALKTLRADYMNNASAVARFHREMEAVGKLDHPNLIRATDAGEDHGIHFLAMEYVEGVDAARLSQVCGPLSIADACELVRQAAVGLHCAHQSGLVHRDVKPSNLMVTPAGRVKVLDLGLALLHAPGESSELTGSNQWMGTADYMAPEQGLDAHAVDIRADVYSLGCTLYKLLTGQAPFGGSDYNTPFKKMDAHAHRPIPPLGSRRPEVPDELTSVIERMMAKAPADRFATPGEAAEALAPFAAPADLSRLVSDARVTPRPVETPLDVSPGVETGAFGPPTPASVVYGVPPSPPRSEPVRRRWWAAAAVLAVFGLVAALFVWWPTKPRREFTPGTWHNVLDHSPVLLLWPAGEFPPQFDDKGERLLVNSRSPCLLGLGTVPAGFRYRVQLGFRQARWTGGIGLFFGYHENGEGATFQDITLIPTGRGNTRFGLCRSTGELRTLPNRQSFPTSHELATQDLPRLAAGEHILDIEVGQAGLLTAVRWDGADLSNLRLGAGAQNERSAHGQFGIVLNGCSAEIVTARIQLYKRD